MIQFTSVEALDKKILIDSVYKCRSTEVMVLCIYEVIHSVLLKETSDLKEFKCGG